jgi:hydroxyacylglutathione hydrolase
MTKDLEIVDESSGVLIRRVVVGPLETNCWMIGALSNCEAVVIDPGAEPNRLIDAVTGFSIKSIVLTHSHWDHVMALPDVADAWGCPVHMHTDDLPVWPHELNYLETHGHFEAGTATAELLGCGCSLSPAPLTNLWDANTTPLPDLQSIRISDVDLQILHTPGHTPGSVSILCGKHVFTGDTLFPGGPGLTGWPLSDFATIMNSIRTKLFTLPTTTLVHPGHGESTTISTELPHFAEWQKRGW